MHIINIKANYCKEDGLIVEKRKKTKQSCEMWNTRRQKYRPLLAKEEEEKKAMTDELGLF